MTESTSRRPPHIRLHIRKEALKFSAAHMTVFPDGTKERLHGHNYRTELSVEFPSQSTTQFLAFSSFKIPMKAICEQWDEKLLLPGRCPRLKIIRDTADELEFSLCGKRYVLPKDEVEILPIDNVITETLAMEFSRRLIEALKPEELRHFTKVELRIEEITGQGASYVWYPA